VRAGDSASGVLALLGGKRVGSRLLVNQRASIAQKINVDLGVVHVSEFARFRVGGVRRDGCVIGGLRCGVGPNRSVRGRSRGGQGSDVVGCISGVGGGVGDGRYRRVVLHLGWLWVGGLGLANQARAVVILSSRRSG
jgi:hypothetical protein